MPAFSFIFDRRTHDAARPGRFARIRREIRTGPRDCPVLPIIFPMAARIDAEISDDSDPPATRRPPIRPHRTAPFHQGIPGIFSHFLRNYG
ncbi:hypothetical protein C7S14_1183 [Burkholderia cepacia]|nr:hypothetical protein C7S14_1183 [Burkholderia cepacia]